MAQHFIYATSSVRFGEALRFTVFYRSPLRRRQVVPFILLRCAGVTSENRWRRKSWTIRMWHGSLHVVGYRENHVVLATGMGGLLEHILLR